MQAGGCGGDMRGWLFYAITCGRGVVGGVLGQSARRQGRPDGRWPVTCLQVLHLEQGTGCSLERKADCAGDQDINGRWPLGSYRQRSVRGGVAEGKDSHCQCQAADDDSGGDRADCRQPDAGKEAGASLRLAEGQYFPWFICLLPVGGSLRVHRRGSRRLPAWRLLEGHVGLLGDVRMASAVKQHRDKRSVPIRVGWRSSGRAAVRSSPGTGLGLLSDRAGKARPELVPPWLGAWPATTRGSSQGEPRDDPRDCVNGPAEQREHKARWAGARRYLKAC